jgi:hypothetical protein
MVVVPKLINLKFLLGVESLNMGINKVCFLSRSSFKGYWYCRNTFKQVYFLSSTKISAVSFFLHRNSNVPNYLTGFITKVESGLLNKKKKLSKLTAGFKNGQFVFTRKPCFYPFKKLKGKGR